MSGGGGGNSFIPSVPDLTPKIPEFSWDNPGKNPFLIPGAQLPGGSTPGRITDEYDRARGKIGFKEGGGIGQGIDEWAANFKKEISSSQALDDSAKQELLGNLSSDNPEYDVILQKYKQILDPETRLGKDMLYRRERAKSAKDTPGLKAQTSFFEKDSTDFSGLSDSSRGYGVLK